jgi:SAM-dependent MidA family methyltransferase
MGDNQGVKEHLSLTSALQARVEHAVGEASGFLPFDRFMAMALYEPGLGYYANQTPKFGRWPATDDASEGAGSDFVTAPELTPLFAWTLARSVAEALQATGTDEVWEFGAGTGALADQLLTGLQQHGALPRRYTIVDLSGALRERQRARLAAWGERVQWVDRLPEVLRGVVVGNEVLDAMPVQLLHRIQGVWHERGVGLDSQGASVWLDRPTDLRPPCEVPGEHDYLTEIHPQAEAFVRTLAERWTVGAGFLFDYGFPESEYYHPERHMGTLIAHRAHRSDDDVLSDVGLKDITAHVNFSGVALAAQDAGLAVLGYTSQGRFLINSGLMDVAQSADPSDRARLQILIHEHEMGELFKVLALAPEASAAHWSPSGFAVGDRSHRL